MKKSKYLKISLQSAMDFANKILSDSKIHPELYSPHLIQMLNRLVKMMEYEPKSRSRLHRTPEQRLSYRLWTNRKTVREFSRLFKMIAKDYTVRVSQQLSIDMQKSQKDAQLNEMYMLFLYSNNMMKEMLEGQRTGGGKQKTVQQQEGISPSIAPAVFSAGQNPILTPAKYPTEKVSKDKSLKVPGTSSLVWPDTWKLPQKDVSNQNKMFTQAPNFSHTTGQQQQIT
jgi:hypothetical protein